MKAHGGWGQGYRNLVIHCGWDGGTENYGCICIHWVMGIMVFGFHPLQGKYNIKTKKDGWLEAGRDDTARIGVFCGRTISA